ncbi:unnamed protein product [Cunninghamella blakesleeana]
MILGIGVDIVHIPRIKKLINRNGADPFARRILSAKEYEEYLEKFSKELNPIQQKQQVLFLGSRWCIKEAVYKALFPVYKLKWSEVTVIKNEGKPALLIKNDVELGIKHSHVSLSHDGEYAIAQVLLEK